MNAFKSQQFRWAKGSIQVAKKLLPTILRSNVPFSVEDRGLLPPDQQLRLPAAAAAVDPAAAEPARAHAPRLARGAADRPAAVLRHDAVDRVVLPHLAARDRQRNWQADAAKRLPLMMSLGIGLCVNQTRAVARGAVRRASRASSCARPSTACARRFEGWTAKKYRAAKTLIPFVEVLFAVYFAVRHGGRGRRRPLRVAAVPAAVPLGFGYVGVLSLHQSR